MSIEWKHVVYNARGALQHALASKRTAGHARQGQERIRRLLGQGQARHSTNGQDKARRNGVGTSVGQECARQHGASLSD